jgi:hypothetical protein
MTSPWSPALGARGRIAHRPMTLAEWLALPEDESGELVDRELFAELDRLGPED